MYINKREELNYLQSLKKTIFVFVFIFISLNTNAQISKVQIMATGLTCSMCSNAISKQIKTLNDVESVVIDLNKNLFVITLKTNNKITPKILRDKVEKAGFFIGSMVLEYDFKNLSVEDNLKIDQFVFIDTKPQILNGIYKVKVLNKGYITTKEFKKFAKLYQKYSAYNKSKVENYFIKTI